MQVSKRVAQEFDIDCFFPMSFSPEAKLPQPQEGTAISLEVQSDLLGLMPHVWLGLNISPKASPSLLGVVN